MASRQATLSEIYTYNSNQVKRAFRIPPDAIEDSTFEETRVERKREIRSSLSTQARLMDMLYSSNDHISYSILTYGNDGIVKNHYRFRTSFEMMNEFIANMDMSWDIEGNMVNTTVSTHV